MKMDYKHVSEEELQPINRNKRGIAVRVCAISRLISCGFIMYSYYSFAC